MNIFKNYLLIEETDGFILEIYLDSQYEEFSSELFKNDEEYKTRLDEQIKQLIFEKFSNLKINTVRLIVGTIVVGTLTLTAANEVFAATTSTNFSTVPINETATVTATSLNMRNGPSTDYSIMHVLWQGDVVKIIGEVNGWLEIKLSDGRTGWSSSQYLQLSNSSAARTAMVNAIINYGKGLIGTPYVYGGSSPSDGGFDCSGFTQYVFKNYGYLLNRISKDQTLNGTYVPVSDLSPGDLVFYSFDGTGAIGHVGIYLGGGLMLNSPKTGDYVKITDITTSYWTSRYVTARRIVQ